MSDVHTTLDVTKPAVFDLSTEVLFLIFPAGTAESVCCTESRRSCDTEKSSLPFILTAHSVLSGEQDMKTNLKQFVKGY